MILLFASDYNFDIDYNFIINFIIWEINKKIIFFEIFLNKIQTWWVPTIWLYWANMETAYTTLSYDDCAVSIFLL